MSATDKALRDAGLFKFYETEELAAKAWSSGISSLQLKYEVGAKIFFVEGHGYAFGATFSLGSTNSVSGLFELGMNINGGKLTGLIHNHPRGGYFSGSDAEYSYREINYSFTPGHSTVGDLVSAYSLGLNAYVARPDGSIYSWNYAGLVQKQFDSGGGPLSLSCGASYGCR